MPELCVQPLLVACPALCEWLSVVCLNHFEACSSSVQSVGELDPWGSPVIGKPPGTSCLGYWTHRVRSGVLCSFAKAKGQLVGLTRRSCQISGDTHVG